MHVAARSQADTTAEQFDAQLRSLLDVHARATRRQVTKRQSAPWYSAVAPQLRALKQERRQAERQIDCELDQASYHSARQQSKDEFLQLQGCSM